MGISQEELWERKRRETVLIVGFGERTGVCAARLLATKGVTFRISDSGTLQELETRLEGICISPEKVYTGEQDASQLEGITSVLLSPGVSPSIPLVMEALRRGMAVESDIDFLYDFIAHKKIVGITGTDGKTTTTSLVGELLSRIGRVVVAGNIGISPLAKYEEILESDYLVLELSSYMLERVCRFRANFAGILNIAEDHIDRYSSIEEYASAKFQLTRHCKRDDILVRNVDDARIASFSPENVQSRTVSSKRKDTDAYYRNGVFHVGGARYRYSDCGLRGLQNIPNILVAATIAHEAGVLQGDIAEVLSSFEGLRHRMQLIGEFAGVRAFDDSKASNVHAVQAALENFEGGVVLILGGRDKGLDFGILKKHEGRIRKLVCYGESGEKIRNSLGFSESVYVYKFEDAVRVSVEESRAGDVILLSPGCTSWDQFANYEVRGDVFRHLVVKYFEEVK